MNETATQQFDEEQKPPYNISLLNKGGEEILYEDIIGYQVSGTVIAVLTKDGETHVFPLSDITFVRHFPKAV